MIKGTENLLKRFLKRRVKITTATVVGFLIMGTVAFGEDIHINNDNGIITQGMDTSGDNFIIENDAEFNIDRQRQKDYAIHVTSGNAEGENFVINKGKINVIAEEAIGIKSNGLIKAIVTNENLIKVKSTKDMSGNPGAIVPSSAEGISINGNGMVTNSGTIESESLSGTAYGVSMEIKNGTHSDGEVIFENKKNGVIKATSTDKGMAYGVYLRNKTSNNLKAINNGTLEVTGENLKILNVVDLASSSGGNLEFINNGTVETKSNNSKIMQAISASGNVTITNNNLISSDHTAINAKTNDKIKIENNKDILFGGSNQGTSGIKIKAEKGNNLSDDEFAGEVINNGKIAKKYEILTEDIVGIDAAGNVKIENNNLIDISGSAINIKNIGGVKYTDSGINGNNAEITNSGVINVLGESAYGISVEKNNNSSNEVQILNKDKGKIIVDGRDAVGVKLSGEKSLFINEGTITLGENTVNGVGIVAVDGATVTNNGTIELVLEDKNGKETDNVAIIIKGNGTATNSGTVKVTDKTAAELEESGFDIKSLFNGTKHTEVTNTGMVVGSDDKAVINEESIYLDDENLTTEMINKEGKEKNSVILGKLSAEENMRDNKTTIKSGTETIDLKSLNIIGKVWIGDETAKNQNIKIGAENINLDKDGVLTIHEGNELTITGSTLNKHGENKNAIIAGKDTKLNLQDVTVLSGNIVGDIHGSGDIGLAGNNILNGNIRVENIAVNNGESRFGGKVEFGNMTTDSNSKAIFSKDSILGSGDLKKITSNGMTVFEIGSEGENALSNALGSVTVTGNIDFDTKNLTKDTEIDLDNTVLNKEHNLENAEYKNKTDGVYITNLNKDNNVLSFTYNKYLFDDDRLNDVNNEMQIVGGITENISEREKLVDNIYSANIYSETVRAFYDNLKLNEDTILSLEKTAKTGEIKTHGKALYSKDEYTREGVKNNFDADVETNGMLAGVEYGISDSVSVGTVFSGVKQDIDIVNGSADGDIFYLGVYGTKTIGKYDFVTGLGYQFGKYEADNNIISNTGDKYDSNTISGYIQGKYTAELEEGLSVQPKIKLGYTHIEQDNAKDKNFGVSDAEISVFDIEIGFDVVKSVQLEKSKLNIVFGTSYIKTMGDTDKEFTGKFYNESENKISNGFNVLGAELAENVLNFELNAEIEKENGVFYNGGFIYQFGSNDTKSYGVNLGVGYKF